MGVARSSPSNVTDEAPYERRGAAPQGMPYYLWNPMCFVQYYPL